MKRKYLTIITSFTLLFVTLACQLLGNQAVSNKESGPAAVEIQATEDLTEPTEDFTAATQAAEESAQATEEAAAAEAEQAAAATSEAAAVAATEEAGVVLTQAAQGDTQATAAAQDMQSFVEQIASDGFLQKTSGTYSRVEDFSENWAQIGWYQWWGTGLAPADFVIRARTEWESASKTANWFDSGCGFVFHEEDENNHYMIFLALDGNVYYKGYVDGVYREFGKGYAGKIDHMKGGADVALAVEGGRVVYFVNGEKVLDRTNSELPSGNLALTIVSGTNKEYGTRCDITNIEVLELTP
jgi:hypothetical protein